MRIWLDKNGRMLTDEQLLRHLAAFGSLSAACGQGDIRLLPKDEACAAPRSADRTGKPSLSDYLKVG